MDRIRYEVKDNWTTEKRMTAMHENQLNVLDDLDSLQQGHLFFIWLAVGKGMTETSFSISELY